MTQKLRGNNIYVDDLGRNVYFDKLSKEAYLIQDKDIKSFSFYSNRFILVVGSIIVFSAFLESIVVCISIATFLLIVLEIIFRKKYLPSLIKLDNFKTIKKMSYVDQEVQTNSRNKTLTKVGLFILLTVLLGLNAYEKEFSGVELIVNYAFMIFAVFLAGLNVKALFVKKNEE